MNNKINVACPYSPWVTYYVPERAYNGYTLFTPMGGSVAWLIDMQGRPVHCWEMAYPNSGFRSLLPNGNIIYGGADLAGLKTEGGRSSSVLVEADCEGNILWEYRDPSQHHAFFRMDNGNTMVLRAVQVPDDIAAKVKGGLPGTGRGGRLRTDAFQEITPNGKVAWEWLAYEHLDPEIDILCPICTRGSWTHINSCFVLPNGDVLTTLHHLDTVCIIDKKSGDIKWRWGRGELAHPHSPNMLDNGNILVFDIGQHRQGMVISYSRILEVNPNTGEIEWEYMDDPPSNFYSTFGGGCQRLPNGNTLITEPAGGRIFEVTPEKDKVWEFNNPFYFEDKTPARMGFCNRVGGGHRYAPDYEGLKELELNPDRVELTLREIPMWRERAALEPRGR